MRLDVKSLRSLAADQGGSMLPIGAAGLLVLLALVGSGVDMSRAYRAQQRLQAACDSGVLAGRRNVTTNGFNQLAQDAANTYFYNNFNSTQQQATGTTFTPTSADGGNSISATASTQIKSAVMNIFGYENFTLSVNCNASMGVGNSDITMVLDVTGSMNDPAVSGGSTSKLADLRAAMKNFYSTVKTATAASNSRIRYAFVPYSHTVNIGKQIYALNPNYLVDQMSIQSRIPLWRQVNSQVFDYWADPVITSGSSYYSNPEPSGTATAVNSNKYSYYNTCIATAPGPGWANSGSPTTGSNGPTINSSGQRVTTTFSIQPQTGKLYDCAWVSTSRRGGYYQLTQTPQTRNYYYNVVVRTQDPVYRTEATNEFSRWQYQRLDNVDVSQFKRGTAVTKPNGPSGTDVSYTWDGCVEERQTTRDTNFSYSSITGISTGALSDLDIDGAPTSTDSTKWKPIWRGYAYYRTDGYGNPVDVTTSTSGSEYVGSVQITSCPAESRVFQEYATQADFDAYPDSLTAVGATYHDVGMIWGGRVSSPGGIWSSLVNQAPSNGGQVSRHLIFMTDGDMAPHSLVNSAYGIEMHDRRTTSNGAASAAIHNARFLAVCEEVKAKGIRVWVISFGTTLTSQLRTCASPGSAFPASDASQLNAAFQTIALEVGELRITQ